MNIQAHLHFTESAVTCVPVDPNLSGYRDRIALDDAALTFRMRLFGARIRMDAMAAQVALVLPGDCVLKSADGGDFDGIPEDELYIVSAGSGAQARRLAVECSAFDEVIAFAKTYGLKPVCVMIPDPDSDVRISLPVVDEEMSEGYSTQDAGAERPGASTVAMPPALERELAKRKQVEDRKSARAAKGWALGKLIGAKGEAEAGAESPASPEVRAEIAPPPSPPIVPEPLQATEPPAMRAPIPAPLQDAVAPAEARAESPISAEAEPSQAEAALAHDTQDEDARLAPEEKGAGDLPRPAIAIGLAAAIGLVAIGGPFLYQGAPGTLPEATEIVESLPHHGQPVPVAAAVAGPPQGVGTDRQSDLESASAPVPVVGSVPHGRPAPEPVTASAAAGRPAAPVMTMAAPKVISAPLISTLPAVSAGPNGVLNIDDGPIRSPVTFPRAPALDQIQPPQVMTGISGGVRLLAAPREAPADSPAAQERVLPAAVSLNARAPLAPPSLQGVAPQPRPIALARAALPQAPQPPAPLLLERAATAGLGPVRAPRPLVRPSTLDAEVQTARVETARATTPAALSAPAATPPVAEPTLDDIPRGSVPGLRVLAIVGSGDQRQALVETGRNQTAVLAAGASTRRWQVIEVRREGVVLWIDGGQRLLPIGL